jgi:hypothetical protein
VRGSLTLVIGNLDVNESKATPDQCPVTLPSMQHIG